MNLSELASKLRDEAARLERMAEMVVTAKGDPTIPEAIEAVMSANGRKYCAVYLTVTKLKENAAEVRWSIYDGDKIKTDSNAESQTLGGALRRALELYRNEPHALEAAVAVVESSTPSGYAVAPPDELLAAHAEYVAGAPAGYPTLDLIEWAKKHAFGPLGTSLAAACKQWLDSLPF